MIDIEKIKAAALADPDILWNSTTVLELTNRLREEITISNQRGEALETAWSELSAVTTDLREAEERADELGADKGTYFRLYEMACTELQTLKARLEAAEKDAARWRRHVELYSNKLCVPEEDVIREIDEARSRD